MCNLNIVVKPKGVNFAGELNFASAHSFATNADGDGAYFSGVKRLVRSTKKIDLTKYGEEVRKSEFVITHQRLASRGFSPINIQPFENERFVIVHNGTLRIKRKKQIKNRSDTFTFFKAFVLEFRKVGEIKRSIENAMSSAVSGGSYSIFLYDKKMNLGYYFKNKDKNISVARLRNGALYITTNLENFVFFVVARRYKVKNDFLYKFKVGRNTVRLSEISKLIMG